MKRRRLTIVLDKEEYAALSRLAVKEERIESQQATILVRRALQEGEGQSR